MRISLADPVTFKYEPHHGPVQELHCSPFHRNLFLTCSSDGSVKIFNANEYGATHSVIPSASVDSYLYDAEWSPVRPFVFAAVSKVRLPCPAPPPPLCIVRLAGGGGGEGRGGGRWKSTYACSAHSADPFDGPHDIF